MAKEFIKIKTKIDQLQDLKTTIKAIEKISSSQLHFLKKKWRNLRLYRESLLEILASIEKDDFSSPFFETKSERRMFLVISSNKKHSGGLFFELFYFLSEISHEDDIIYILGNFGKKIAEQMKIKYDLAIKEPVDLSSLVKNYLIPSFLKGKVGKIYIIYPEFRNLNLFVPKMEKYLPLEKDILEEQKPYKGYVFWEPNKEAILQFLIDDYLEVSITEKFFETKFCEFWARTITMERAEERIKNIVKNLQLLGFKMRKREITKNLTDLYSSRHYH
ncbi:F0F1 ATP synthase subunit gamma [bacterium]|nr:F0F1 ATP synthase subunit gamma [bacterium]